MDIYEQQGGDITASDMILPDQDSDIQKFYKDSTIFITGATGFLGKLCMEKLLRTCHELNRIYILVRPKKGNNVEKRFDELFDEPCFDPLKRKYPDFRHKVHMLSGDCSQPDLGLSPEDKATLLADVDCVFHFAATVRFDEKLRTAANINVRAIRDLVRLGRHMKKLRAMVHVSTAYSNCTRPLIDEVIYEPPISSDKLLTLVDCLDDEKLAAVTPQIIGDFPNTYVYTKCIAEDTIKKEAKYLPIAVVRPSIVIATAKEPVSGWIDNVYGATGVLLGVATGLLRILKGGENNKADMVPADYVINSCLAAAWDIATIKSLNENKQRQDEYNIREEQFEKETPVYNCVSTSQNPLTWKDFYERSLKHCLQIPSEKVFWHAGFAMTENKIWHLICVFFLHNVPAYIVDFIAVCLGKKPLLVNGYKKINKFSDVISYFTMRQWIWKNNNTQSLWNRLKKRDQELFEFNMELLNWDQFFYTYTRGARVYLLKDPLDTIPQGRVKYYKMLVAHRVLQAALLFLLYKIVTVILGFIF